jgi:hypothetical protein
MSRGNADHASASELPRNRRIQLSACGDDAVERQNVMT